MIHRSTFFGRRAGLLLALALALPLGAQAQESKQPHSPSEKTSEALQQLRPLMEAKNWDGILAVLDKIPDVKPGSYDQAIILDMKAKVYMSKEQLGRAIEPLETALKLSDQHEYFGEDQTQQTVNLLARLIYAEAVNVKDKAQQQQLINRSAAYLKRYLQTQKKPTSDDTMFYAQLLYAQATATDKINPALLREAREVIEKGMLNEVSPKEGFYQLLVALVLQENDYTRSAELLELVVQKYPTKKDYWPQLMVAYLQLAGGEKDPLKVREYYIRAINAVERAQALGIMNDPKNNYNLVTFYIAVEQYSKATEILYAGLKNGSIESNVANWRILASQYQQANRELQAIEALKEAAKLFPKEGMVDLHIGEIYRGLDKTTEAREFYRSAIRKGNLEKPYVAYQLLAFAEMEVENWPAALEAITEASKAPEFQKDKQMISLKEHIENTVKLQEAEKAEKAKEAAAKKA